jgi:hypothetical protein
MTDGTVHERLRQARIARGEAAEALARRVGVRVEYVRAIEDGRFADLPRGIYARAAVRSLAAACALDPAAVLAACEPLLPAVEEPIGALARLHAVRRHAEAPAARPDDDRAAAWRAVAATAIDACVVAAMFSLVLLGSAGMLGARPPALAAGALPLAFVAMVGAAAYFLWFGGLVGVTAGAALLHVPPGSAGMPLTLREIAVRAGRAATADLRAIRACGTWSAVRLASLWARSVPRHGPWPSAPRSPDPAPAPMSPASPLAVALPPRPRRSRD